MQHPEKRYQEETLSIREQTPRGAEREHSTPIFMTSSFVFESAEQARAIARDTGSGIEVLEREQMQALGMGYGRVEG